MVGTLLLFTLYITQQIFEAMLMENKESGPFIFQIFFNLSTQNFFNKISILPAAHKANLGLHAHLSCLWRVSILSVLPGLDPDQHPVLANTACTDAKSRLNGGTHVSPGSSSQNFMIIFCRVHQLLCYLEMKNQKKSSFLNI